MNDICKNAAVAKVDNSVGMFPRSRKGAGIHKVKPVLISCKSDVGVAEKGNVGALFSRLLLIPRKPGFNAEKVTVAGEDFLPAKFKKETVGKGRGKIAVSPDDVKIFFGEFRRKPVDLSRSVAEKNDLFCSFWSKRASLAEFTAPWQSDITKIRISFYSKALLFKG